MLDHAWMMVTVRVADSGRAAPPSRGGVNNARRRRKFCEGRGENGHFLKEKTGGKVEFHRVGCSLHCNAVLLLISCRCSMLLFLCSCSCWYSSCTADVLAALLPHTQQRERPAQRSALSATALTSKHVAASSAAATNAMAPTARSAPLEKFEPLARRQKRPFACTFWACEFQQLCRAPPWRT